jgi:hypothetical protein
VYFHCGLQAAAIFDPQKPCGRPPAARFDALHAERLRLELLGQDLERQLRDKRAALEYTGAKAAPHATIRQTLKKPNLNPGSGRNGV